MWINVALTNIWGKNIDAPTNFLNIWSVPFENIIPRLDPLMLGFLDEILPLLRLCYVQRDLIIGVSGNSSKSCRYFLNQSCRFIPGGWSTLITCNLINTVAVLVFRFVFFFIAQSLTFRTMSTQLYDVLLWRYLCTWIVWKRLFYWHNNFQSLWEPHWLKAYDLQTPCAHACKVRLRV